MQKISRKFLLIFSVCMLAVGGIVWACADGDYDDSIYSNFAPEAFVASQYSPFFYASSVSYYDRSDDNSNTRYNDVVLDEWDNYFEKKVDKKYLKSLLFDGTDEGTNSSANKTPKVSPAYEPELTSKSGKRKMETFLSYLQLAKACEYFTVNAAGNSWDEKVVPSSPDDKLKADLLNAFEKTKDSFIKERLWFQLVRCNYFQELQITAGVPDDQSELVTFFNKYASQFPKNTVYYRALGYLAGHYYRQKDYARANYLYSLCYNFSAEMKIPSKWSFHPQNESDWEKCLQMAKNNEEKITLWQMLGISSDEARAIEKIYAIDPGSEKLELLLSRLVNIMEGSSSGSPTSSAAEKNTLIHDREMVSNIARKNNTSKPYYWNLAAGYLNTLSGDYAASRQFYDRAKTQLPKNDSLIMAQYKILDWTLYVSQLRKIDAKAESEMVGTINWLADLRDGKDTIQNLRYDMAVENCTKMLSDLYKKQGDLLKSNCFASNTAFYASNENIEALKALLNKSHKTAFESAMLRYYHLTMDDLYYHQGLMLVYQEKTDQAIALMEKSGKNAQFKLLANPFSIHINDCHDCDFEAVQKIKYTPLSFLKTIRTLKADIVAGKNVYTNTFLLADAYYNITYYGNARTFYQTVITSAGDYGTSSAQDIPVEFNRLFTSGKIAEKYYLLARSYAKNKEQQTRCTFMAAKCERNDIYNKVYNDAANANKYSWDFDFETIPTGKYFAELKSKYSHTQYYQEILDECGYFLAYTKKHGSH